VWSVDTTSATWHEPVGAQALVENMADSYPFFMGVEATAGSEVSLMLAIAEGEAQDFCSRTVMMPEMQMSRDGSVAFGPADYVLANGFTIEDFKLTGRFSEDFEQMNEVAITGNLNLSTAPPDMLPGSGDLSACELAASFNIDCNTCRDGQNECMQTHTTGVFANRVAINLVEITEADCHGQCEASAENPECE